MAPPRLALAVIGDEIGPTLAEMISFCSEHGVSRLDMRTVDGRNLLAMTLGEVTPIAATLKSAGLEVPTLVSPLLKWPAPGQAPAGGPVDFAFDPAQCPQKDVLAHAFDIAAVLGASRIRVFSHLRYPGFAPGDLHRTIDRLQALSAERNILVEIENEPVCNLGSIAELAWFFEALPGAMSRPRPLVDIGNSYAMGARPDATDIAYLAPMVDLIHLKDRDLATGRTVPLGDGDIPWADELERLLSHIEAPEIVASIETHCPHDGRNATAQSVKTLRRLAGDIGAEIV
ncbi:MAG: sugar phosphate isomerase/epimerase [Proteobacteria bacterium]|nr:sugar phosphate isomerase/epimerase [Pseudomonadota bacterium]